MKEKNKRILVAPLDWGLGHASRCVPVIKELLKQEAEVIIAADRQPLAFLQKEFPLIETIRLPGYDITYPSRGNNMASKMMVQIPKILSMIKEENKWLKKIIKEKKIMGIISDQRFGLHTQLVPCVFISHQIMIKAPYFENILHDINESFIKKYTECWIPDYPGPENLSGDLSHKYPLPPNAKFIGPLSRFYGIKFSETEPHFQIMAILSGPEPQRTEFENIVLSQIRKSGLSALVLRGLADKEEHGREGSIEIHSHLPTEMMAAKISASGMIISRPGYSTIMDLAVLRKKAIFIPTPGQTEQEYLAKYHLNSKHFFSTKQKSFDLEKSIRQSANFLGIKQVPQASLLKNIIRQFTKNC